MSVIWSGCGSENVLLVRWLGLDMLSVVLFVVEIMLVVVEVL